MSEETPPAFPVAPVPPAPATAKITRTTSPAPTPTPINPAESTGGRAPVNVVRPTNIGGKAVYGVFDREEAPVEEDTSPKFKMLVNCGEFATGQIVSAKDVEDKYPDHDNWIKRGILRKYTPPVEG